MYCIDTDIAIEFLRGNNIITSHFEQFSDSISTTPITMLELCFGAHRSARLEESLRQVNELFKILPLLEFNEKVYDNFGLIKQDLMKKGQIIDNFDLVIASFCLAYNKTLVTNNTKHFERISGLKIKNWLR